VGQDEAFSLTLTRLPWGQMMDSIIKDFVHPPLHYFALCVWFKLFGFSVLQARLLSTCFGVLAILLIYWLVRYLFESRTALLSSALLAVSQLGVMFSQEARPYALLLFLVLFSSCLFAKALREKRAVAWLGFVLSSALMVYTHYYGALVLIAFLLYAILYRKQYALPRSWWVGGAILILILYAPWLSSGIVQQALSAPKTHSGVNPWWAVHWWTPFTATNAFNNGKWSGLLDPAPLWTFVVGGLLFTVPALLALKPLLAGTGDELRQRLDREGVLFLALLWLLPLLLVLGMGIVSIQYNVRYMAFSAAPYYALVARGISALPSRRLRGAVIALLLAYSVSSLRANYFVPWKEQFRQSVDYVLAHHSQGDCCVFLPFGVPRQWTITQGSRLPVLSVTTAELLVSEPSKCRRVWVIAESFQGNQWVWRRSEAGRRQIETTHAKVGQKRYFGVDIDLYSLRGQ